MNNHQKKIIAPLIVTICISLYYSIGGVILYKSNLSAIIKITAVVFSIVITVVFIIVLIERIREIKKGEEDDLGKY